VRRPTPFGKYYLLDRINVGGMAEVFRAKATGVEGFEKLVAIKRILPNIAEDDEFITMFIDEAKIAVQLTHANIAQIFDLGKIEDSYFIALEFVPGKDLRTMFERCRKRGEVLPVPMSCYVISRVCEGLDYAHRKKDIHGRDLHIVHRDVSPQNILVSYEGEVKLIDFGIAKAANKASKTQAGILKGKFGYMSPEQVRGLPIDRRSDIFSVGIVLYELLTGERLFVGESDFSTLEKVRNVEIMPPSTYNTRIPEELESIVLKALSREPEERFQTAAEMQEELTRFLVVSGNMFSRKDLAHYMKQAFSDDIAREQAALDQFRQAPAAPSAVAIAAQMVRPPPPPPAAARPVTPVPPRPVPPAPAEDDLATRVYDSRPPYDDSRPPYEAASADEKTPAREPQTQPLLEGLHEAEAGRVAVPITQETSESGLESLSLNTNISAVPMYRGSLVQSARRRRLVMAVAGVVVVAAAAVIFIYLRGLKGGRPARLEVVSSPGATIQVCDGSNCRELGSVPDSGTLGAEHVTGKFRFVARQAGCQEREVQATLVSKGTNQVVLGRLDCAAARGSLRIETDPPQALVRFLRPDLSGGSGPAPLVRRELPAGSYEIEVVKDGFFSRRLSVVIPAGAEVRQAVSLPAKRVEVLVETVPKGASVVVRDGTTGQVVAEPDARTPLKVKIERRDLASTFRVEISKKGYETLTGPLILTGQPSQKLAAKPLELQKKEGVAKKKKKKPRPVEPTTPSPPEPQYGELDVNLKGAWAYVHIDGKSTGRHTPIVGMKLKAGRHRVTLVREELRLLDEFFVDIAPNRLTRAVRIFKARE
jgi:serine/threonine protein kinase